MKSKPPEYELTKELGRMLGDESTTVQQKFDEFLEWMLKRGKNPDRKKGLAQATAKNYCDRLDQVYRLVIYLADPNDKTRITQDEADLIIKWLDEDEIQKKPGETYSETAKRKFANTVLKYFKWKVDTGRSEDSWTPNVSFSQSEYDSADKLNFEERWKLREAAKEYGSLPSYADVSPEERDRIKGLVAQRVGIPKDEITRRDWERADQSTKIGSLIAVGLDTGITPIEVGEARVQWYDQHQQVLEIPSEYASKERPTEKLPVCDDTEELMSRWIRERRHLEKYDGTDRLWLNQKGNPYDTANLCDLVRRLCDETGINYENRKIVWYSLRHNVGQSIEEVEDISEARDQLRHSSIEITKQFYAKTAIESRRQTLEDINDTARRAAEVESFNPYDTDNEGTDKARYPDETTKSPPVDASGGNSVHADVHFKDTPERRIDIAQQILSGEGVDNE